MKSLVSCILLSVTVTLYAQQPPPVFDLRDYGGQNFVTPIKTQQGGTCWTHGALAAMEGNLFLSGIWTAAGEAGVPDLAEYHLDWWNGFNDFYNEDATPPAGTGIQVHMGGDYRVTTAYLSRGEGAIREADAPQAYNNPPSRFDTNYHFFYPRHVEWYVVGQNLANISLVKQRVMTHGVMGTCLCSNGAFMNSEFEHYQPPSNSQDPNHAVAIIGWDDNRVTQAPLPGAWLIKNSWGASWGNAGYFWISYYDKHCGQHPEMGAISFQQVEPFWYDKIHFYDYHGWRDTRTDISEAFNAYVTQGGEKIKAMSFFTASDSVDYIAAIFGNFNNGILSDTLAWITGSFNHTGFHTVDLPIPVSLPGGDDFFAYLYVSAGGQAFDRTSDVPVLLGGMSRPIVPSSAAPGESFYWNGSSWQDFYNFPLPQYGGTGNFCIKVLTVDDPSAGILPGPASAFEVQLLPAYPNPCTDMTQVRFMLQQPVAIEIGLFDIQGRKVREVLNACQPAGETTLNLDVDDLVPGIYILQMQAGDKVFSEKIMKF